MGPGRRAAAAGPLASWEASVEALAALDRAGPEFCLHVDERWVDPRLQGSKYYTLTHTLSLSHTRTRAQVRTYARTHAHAHTCQVIE